MSAILVVLGEFGLGKCDDVDRRWLRLRRGWALWDLPWPIVDNLPSLSSSPTASCVELALGFALFSCASDIGQRHCHTCESEVWQGGAGEVEALPHHHPLIRGGGCGVAEFEAAGWVWQTSIIGSLPDFDEFARHSFVVFAFDDHEHAVQDPCLEQGGDLGAVRLVLGIEFQDVRHGAAGPVFCL